MPPLPPPSAATPHQISNGSQNPMQFQPQNQTQFCNPNHMNNSHGHPVPNMTPSMFQPGLMNVQNHLVPMHNNALGMPQFASFMHSAQSNGCNMSSAHAFPTQGPFNMAPNVNQMNPCVPMAQFFGQFPNLVQSMNGQFCLPYQNMNQHIPGQMLNVPQVPHPSSHAPYGGPNQAVPMVLQNPALSANQPFGFNQVLHPANQNQQNFIPQTMGVNGPSQLPGSAQKLQGSSSMPFNSLSQPPQAGNLQSPVFAGKQGNSSINDGGNRPNSCSKNSAPANFTGNLKKGFQKNQHHQMKHEKKRFGFPGRQKGKGFHKEGGNKFGAPCSTNEVKNQKRPPIFVYTEQEIQKWREARRKNHPSSANIQKRLAEKQTDCQLADREARNLRQELQEILAKQAELGVEVADIPSEYLSYSNNRDKTNRHNERNPLTREEANDGNQRTKGPSARNEKPQNKFNKRGGRHDKKHRSRKKVKSEKQPSNASSLNEREPTLLQKLLKVDMKRDKSQLLQALRFMVMNSFFNEWPNKPLVFPSVVVKENGCDENFSSHGTKNIVEKLDGIGDDAHDNGEKDDDSGGDSDDKDSDNVVGEAGGKMAIPDEEEGEIID